MSSGQDCNRFGDRMKIKKLSLGRYFRGKGRCDFCGSLCRQREWAHIIPRSRYRLDIPINSVSLGGPWDCACHVKHHERKEPTEAQLIEVVAKRYGITSEQVREELRYVMALDKYADPYDPVARLALLQEANRGKAA